MPSTVAARPGKAELVDEKGLSALESLARAARQTALYGPDHPIAARALQDVCREVTAETSKREITLGVEEDCLLWNGKRASGGSMHLRRLHEMLRERLIASLRLTSRFDAAGLSRLLLILTEDPKLLVTSGGVMRAYGPEGPAGILVEDIDFTQELRECEASWVEVCAEVDPEAVEPLREILESCLHIVRSASENLTLEQMREALAEEPRAEDAAVSPVEAIASTIAALVQSAGEIAVHTGSARREAWENSILRQFDALGPRWSAYIFRAPTAVTPGSPDILSLLARQMDIARRIALILDYPGGIVTERSEGLSLGLRRILSDSARAAEIERELHRQAVYRGISEDVYRNVVGMLMPEMAKLSRSEAMWKLLDGGEESLRAEDPQLELSDLMETTSVHALRRARTFMLLDLLDAEMNASQYGSVIKALLEMTGKSMNSGEVELLTTILEHLKQEASEVEERSSGRRAIAMSALRRSASHHVVSLLVRALGRSSGEQRSRVMRLLGHLDDKGMEALARIAGRTHDLDSMEALQVLARQDGPAYSHLRQFLGELPLGDLHGVLRTLVGTGCPAVLAQLNVVIARDEPQARMALIRVVDETGKVAGADIVIRLLTDAEPSIRAAAADVLGKLKVADAVPALCYLLGRESNFGHGSHVKAAAARALGEIRSPEAVPTLAQLLFNSGLLSLFASKDPKVAAAEALGKIGTAEARQVVEDWGRCGHDGIRQVCQRVLREMGGVSALGAGGGGSNAG